MVCNNNIEDQNMTTHFNTRLSSFQATQQSNLLSFLLSHLTGQAAQPNYAQYLALNKALQCGDPQMEKVPSQKHHAVYGAILSIYRSHGEPLTMP